MTHARPETTVVKAERPGVGPGQISGVPASRAPSVVACMATPAAVATSVPAWRVGRAVHPRAVPCPAAARKWSGAEVTRPAA